MPPQKDMTGHVENEEKGPVRQRSFHPSSTAEFYREQGVSKNPQIPTVYGQLLSAAFLESLKALFANCTDNRIQYEVKFPLHDFRQVK